MNIIIILFYYIMENNTIENSLINNSNKKIHFTENSIRQAKYKSSILKFSRFYGVTKPAIKYLIVIFLGMFLSFITLILVESTGLYIGGIGAFLQGVARLVYATTKMFHSLSDDGADKLYNFLFWFSYLFVNIPILIFAYYKINKKFAIYSAVFLITNQCSGFLWTLIPGFDTITIFGSTSTVNQWLSQYNIQSIVFANYVVPGFDSTHNIFIWTEMYASQNSSDFSWTYLNLNNVSAAFELIIYSIIYSLFSGVIYSIIFSLSASTAGSDIISIYFSQKKNKPIGFFIIVFNSLMMFLGVLVGSYLPGVIYGSLDQLTYHGQVITIDPDIKGNPFVSWHYILTANLFASFLWILLHGTIINFLFPWQKFASVQIYLSSSNSQKKVIKLLKNINYYRPVTFTKGTGGFTNNSKTILEAVMQVVEVPLFIDIIHKLDPNCFTTVYLLSDIDGKINVKNQTK